MSMDKKTVEHVAKLARIQLNDADVPAISKKLSNIMKLIDQMSAVDTTGVEPMAHPFGLSQRLREDVITEKDQREAFQAIAPAVEKDLYLVPKVVE